MFKNKHLLVICFFYVFFSCKKEASLVFLETNFTSENNKIVEVNIPLASENNDVAKTLNLSIYDHVISALQIGESNSSPTKSIEESINKFNTEYNSFISNFPENTQKWEAQIDGEVLFKSEEIISISLTSYINTGGAHGNLNISFLNFDVLTGELIENHKLFSNVKAFKTIAKKYFDDEVEGENILIENCAFQLPKNIGFSDEGIILLYNINEIAPYITDIIEFTIPIEKAKPYLIFNSL